MSSRKAVEKALRRADKRDKKRKTQMKVSGSSVKTLSRIINRPR
jgi:hypothetical protein